MKTMNRREMLKSSVLTVGAVCTCRVLDAFAAQSDCCNTPDLEPASFTIEKDRIVIDLTTAESLAGPGHAAYIRNEDKYLRIIVIHTDPEQYVALWGLCTHGRQVVSYNPDRRLVQCNSYNHSLFNLDGVVFKGPAPDPLGPFKVVKEQETLTIYLKEPV